MDPLSIIASSIAVAHALHVTLESTNHLRLVLQQLEVELERRDASANPVAPNASLFQAISLTKTKLDLLLDEVHSWQLSADSSDPAAEQKKFRILRIGHKAKSFRVDLQHLKSSLGLQLMVLTASTSNRIEVDLQQVLLLARDEITRHGQFHNDVQQQLKQQECSLGTLLALRDKDPLVSDVSSSDTVQTPPSDVQASGRLNGEPATDAPEPKAFHHNGKILFESSRLTAISAVGIRTAQFPRPACTPWCSCVCHERHHLRTPQFLEQFVGSLFVGYSGLPRMTKPCNQASCHLRAQPMSTVTYFFPRWFVSKALSLVIATTPLAGPVVSLKVQRTVPGDAPIFNYAMTGDVERMKMLFLNGQASPHDVDFRSGVTPLHTFPRRIEEALRRMFSETECIERRDFTVLHKIVLGLVSKDLELELRSSTADIDAVDSNNRTALSLAAERGDLDAVNLFLDFGANVHIASTSLSTPLHFAARAAEPSCIAPLISKDADVNALTNHNQTPLIYAAAYTKDARHASLLIEAGAFVDFPDLDGITALGWTAISGNTPVATLLVQYNANVDNIDNAGQTCLSRSISSNNHEIIRLLVAKGASTRTNLPRGSNLMHIIAEHADLETLHLLHRLDLSAVGGDRNHSDRTPLDILRSRADHCPSLEMTFSLIGTSQADSDADDVWYDARSTA
ncbi:Ankyrin repeat and SOCS box protein 6 [Exophiala xenobiotica]|nr:Ankyrin repeat and SOCS box protein 6 [Exophiala xenobiotica]